MFHCFPTHVNACCRQRFVDIVFPRPQEIVADFSLPHTIIAALVFRHVRTIKDSFLVIVIFRYVRAARTFC
jgi:hypothetical protein